MKKITMQLTDENAKKWDEIFPGRKQTLVVSREIFPQITQEDFALAEREYLRIKDQEFENRRALTATGFIEEEMSKTYLMFKSWCKPLPVGKVLPLIILKKASK